MHKTAYIGEFIITVRKKDRNETYEVSSLRANVCNFPKSVDSREVLTFFIFCPNNLYSTLIYKNHIKTCNGFLYFKKSGKV